MMDRPDPLDTPLPVPAAVSRVVPPRYWPGQPVRYRNAVTRGWYPAPYIVRTITVTLLESEQLAPWTYSVQPATLTGHWAVDRPSAPVDEQDMQPWPEETLDGTPAE